MLHKSSNDLDLLIKWSKIRSVDVTNYCISSGAENQILSLLLFPLSFSSLHA